MTHSDSPQDEELYGALRSAIGSEPPMASLPADDLARGRRRLRHHRIGAAAGVAAVVPAVALISTLVPGNPSAGPAPGGFADDPGDDSSLEVQCAVVGPERDGDLRPPAGDGSCEAVPGVLAWTARGKDLDSMNMPEVDRLDQALTEAVDPSEAHVVAMVASGARGGASAAALSQASVGATWSQGSSEGAVNLSVVDPDADGPGTSTTDGDSPCADPSLVHGPALACATQELDNGAVVLVGTGEQDGARRITVRFERADGQIVWATADQASDGWWRDRSGADPLDAPPASTEQLIELVQDPRVHL